MSFRCHERANPLQLTVALYVGGLARVEARVRRSSRSAGATPGETNGVDPSIPGDDDPPILGADVKVILGDDAPAGPGADAPLIPDGLRWSQMMAIQRP